MKSRTEILPILLIILINIGFLLSLYWFPVTRDEFYYLDKTQLPYVFSEYWTSYNFVNPRSGQFFLNIVARSQFLKLIFGLFLFNGFLIALFANVFRRFPKFSSTEDAWKYLILAAAVIFLINYFGELFYYSPFATNYTFTHVLYLLYLFAMTEYFIFKKHIFPKSFIKKILLCFGAFVMGMGNEHVPPVLLLFSAVFGLIFIFQNKKLPDFRIIIVNISAGLGYLALFFAPANAVKYKNLGKTQYSFSGDEYFSSFMSIIKYYYYYNAVLIIVGALTLCVFIFLLSKQIFDKHQKSLIGIYAALGITAIFVISYSPLIGTRLMFFSTLMIIIVIFMILKKIVTRVNQKIIMSVSALWLCVFFVFSININFKANEIFVDFWKEISEKSEHSQNVILRKKLNYFEENSPLFNRKILFENGTEYIDKDTKKCTPEEKNLILYFNLKTLSHQ